jgi:hypothetical protein
MQLLAIVSLCFFFVSCEDPSVFELKGTENKPDFLLAPLAYTVSGEQVFEVPTPSPCPGKPYDAGDRINGQFAQKCQELGLSVLDLSCNRYQACEQPIGAIEQGFRDINLSLAETHQFGIISDHQNPYANQCLVFDQSYNACESSEVVETIPEEELMAQRCLEAGGEVFRCACTARYLCSVEL